MHRQAFNVSHPHTALSLVCPPPTHTRWSHTHWLLHSNCSVSQNTYWPPSHSGTRSCTKPHTLGTHIHASLSRSLVSLHSLQHSQVSRCLIHTSVSPSLSPRSLSLLVIFHTQAHHLPNTLRSLLHCRFQPPHSPDPAETAASSNPACRPRETRRTGLWEV